MTGLWKLREFLEILRRSSEIFGKAWEKLGRPSKNVGIVLRGIFKIIENVGEIFGKWEICHWTPGCVVAGCGGSIVISFNSRVTSSLFVGCLLTVLLLLAMLFCLAGGSAGGLLTRPIELVEAPIALTGRAWNNRSRVTWPHDNKPRGVSHNFVCRVTLTPSKTRAHHTINVLHNFKLWKPYLILK